MRKSPRERRLHADFQSLQLLRDESTIFSFEATGSPPEKYRFLFQGAGVSRDEHGKLALRQRHEILIELGAAYPRMMPNLVWQTPVFHPNISNNGVVCLGGYGTHWVPSLTLCELAVMLWDMIRYKNFDTESPYNRDAAAWAKTQTDFGLPVDHRSIRDRVSGEALVAVESEPLSGVAEAGQVETSAVDDIEIIETGIEIVEVKDVAASAGIQFID